MYEMKNEYLTGIEMIDEEHTKLFEIADKLYNLLNDQFIPDKYDYILEVVGELKDYAKKHFADEEAYMEKINYKRMFTQKIQHAEFVEKMSSYNPDKIDADQKEACMDILEFINNWLVEHILENDLKIAEK
ncbi:bacteriohemerythrin [[Clostridium] fimetarium]|uniref:Hemerythrin n=1 Tax=[Clostridium] fimetarium TaxID=99656 RepID=A0A1I0M8T3_9FIRM|nr:hemerythrin family protein [[Clostridium] fimetarium]SEV84116.1 hemerythrin [[Clostridium] fimetarium]